MIDEYQVKTLAKFNKNRKVCSQGLVLSPKISLIVLPRHLSKSEQTQLVKIRKILAFLHKTVVYFMTSLSVTS